jgi:hypothetical protein
MTQPGVLTPGVPPNNRELWTVQCKLPRWAYHELLMALVEEPKICSIQR